MINLITSLNKALFNLYGERAIKEFAVNSDGSVHLHIYFEGDGLPNFANSVNISFHQFDSDGHRNFIRKFGHLQEANGLKILISPEGDGQRIKVSKDFRYDACRFSFKIFCLSQFHRSHPGGGLFGWIDADIRVLRPFSSKDLRPFFPDSGQLMSYLGRRYFPNPNPYSEAGWLGFNGSHAALDDFFGYMENLYTSGDIFAQREWHDSWLWDCARLEFEKRNVEFRNISGQAEVLDHPFVNCGLGQFFDHLKGPERKSHGNSFKKDYR